MIDWTRTRHDNLPPLNSRVLVWIDGRAMIGKRRYVGVTVGGGNVDAFMVEYPGEDRREELERVSHWAVINRPD